MARFSSLLFAASACVSGYALHKNRTKPVLSKSWGWSSPTSDPPRSLFREVERDITLYQYATCPFCCKVRTFLDFKGIPYRIVEVTPISKPEMKWTDIKKVPLLKIESSDENSSVTDPLLLKESSVIVSLFQSYIHSKDTYTLSELNKFYQQIYTKDDIGFRFTLRESPPDSLLSSFKEEAHWRRWVDDHLVHVIAPNIYRSIPEALDSFKHITRKGKFVGKENSYKDKVWLTSCNVFGALAMWAISKHLRRKYSLSKDPRFSLYESIEVWLEAIGDRKFHGGELPDLADLAVFGTLRSMEDMDAHTDMLQHTKIMPWYARMNKLCRLNSRQVLSDNVANPQPEAQIA